MTALSCKEVLALLPQQSPMRFVDSILELDFEHIVGSYLWKREDCEHYTPGRDAVPPFKLVEMAAQVGTTAWCIYHMAKERTAEEVKHLVGVFTQIERFSLAEVVRPGDTVVCEAVFGEEGYFRGNKIVSEVRACFRGGERDGRLAFSGLLSGLFIPKAQAA